MVFRVDASDVDALASDLSAAPDRLRGQVGQIVERGAFNVRRGAQRLIRGQITGRYLPHYPRAITYDIERAADVVAAEIGPESGMPQGGMGPGVEFGSANAPPLPHLIPAYEAELPRFYRFLAQASGEVLGG